MILMPLAAAAQVAPEPEQAPAPTAPAPKYSVYVGYAYSTINQVNLSRYGLQGVQVEGARNFGRYFSMVGIADYYRWATAKGNPGNPSMTSFLVGPQFRVNLAGPVDGFFRGTMGAEHSGGESQTPDYSFAGGIGGGLDYNLSHHLAVRLSGDRIGASFSLINNSPTLNYSPHLTWNTRASFGVVYKF
jgi:hypothetical protein